MLLVDTNVLVDVLQDDPQWVNWSIGQLRAQSRIHAVVINPVVYAEISFSFSTIEALDKVIDTLALQVLEVPRPALFLAGKVRVHGVLPLLPVTVSRQLTLRLEVSVASR
jgi:predicted nucleic acid-binding protein